MLSTRRRPFSVIMNLRMSDGPFSSCTADTISTSHPVAAGWRSVAGCRQASQKLGCHQRMPSRRGDEEKKLWTAVSEWRGR